MNRRIHPTKYSHLSDEEKKKKDREINKKNQSKYRLETLTHYSNGKMKCNCCDESIYQFLTVDSLNGGDSQLMKKHGTHNLAWLLRKLEYPEGYQVLCMNCNFARGKYGICPHKLN